MKTSTEIYSTAEYVGNEKAIEYVAKAGFDAWDFSMFHIAVCDRKTMTLQPTNDPVFSSDYIGYCHKLRKIGTDNGIVCNQSHAPFPSCGTTSIDVLKRAIECTAEAGGKICVVHPNNSQGVEENAEMYRLLLPFAKQHDVKIAIENMWNWDDDKDCACPAACSDEKSFNEHLDVVNDPYLVACLDIGHSEMRGLNTSAEKMILALGDRLQALHIHDNNKWEDSHQIPFSMSIDFEKVVAALKKIGYGGYFTLESDRYLEGRSADSVFESLCEMSRVARRLADMFEKAEA